MVRDNLVTIFDGNLTIFQPTSEVAHAFKAFMDAHRSTILKTYPRDADNLFKFPLESFSTSNHKKKCCITRYFTVASSNLREAVLFWHEATGRPSVDVMVQLAQHPPVGWLQELTPAVVRKYYPQNCISCPLGNLQDTDRYDNFNPTVIS